MRCLIAGLASLSTLTVPTAAVAQENCALINALTSREQGALQSVSIVVESNGHMAIAADGVASLIRGAEGCEFAVRPYDHQQSEHSTAMYGESEPGESVEIGCEWEFPTEEEADAFLDHLRDGLAPCLGEPFARQGALYSRPEYRVTREFQSEWDNGEHESTIEIHSVISSHSLPPNYLVYFDFMR